MERPRRSGSFKADGEFGLRAIRTKSSILDSKGNMFKSNESMSMLEDGAKGRIYVSGLDFARDSSSKSSSQLMRERAVPTLMEHEDEDIGGPITSREQNPGV